MTVNGVTDTDGVGLDGTFSSSFTTLSSPLAADAGPQVMLDGSASTGTGATFTWNTQGAVNRVYGSLGTASGGFDFSPANQLHPVQTDWDQFTVYLADVNGNGRQDVIWNHAASENRIYVGISRRQN